MSNNKANSALETLLDFAVCNHDRISYEFLIRIKPSLELLDIILKHISLYKFDNDKKPVFLICGGEITYEEYEKLRGMVNDK